MWLQTPFYLSQGTQERTVQTSIRILSILFLTLWGWLSIFSEALHPHANPNSKAWLSLTSPSASSQECPRFTACLMCVQVHVHVPVHACLCAVPVCTHIWRGACVCTCPWKGQRRTSDVLIHHSLLYSVEVAPVTDPEVRLVINKLQRSSCSFKLMLRSPHVHRKQAL